MRGQAERLLERDDASLLHDELAEINDAVYFHEFVAHAARARPAVPRRGRLLRDADRRAPEPAADALLAVEDRVRREQYLDFLKGRMFRQTLLCHAGRAIDRTPRPAVVERLAFSTQAQVRGSAARG